MLDGDGQTCMRLTAHTITRCPYKHSRLSSSAHCHTDMLPVQTQQAQQQWHTLPVLSSARCCTQAAAAAGVRPRSPVRDVVSQQSNTGTVGSGMPLDGIAKVSSNRGSQCHVGIGFTDTRTMSYQLGGCHARSEKTQLRHAIMSDQLAASLQLRTVASGRSTGRNRRYSLSTRGQLQLALSDNQQGVRQQSRVYCGNLVMGDRIDLLSNTVTTISSTPPRHYY